MNLQEKTAVVTGATGGIGLAIATSLLEKGVANLGIVDISRECVTVTDSLAEQYSDRNVRPFQGDVTDQGFRRQVFDELESDFGPVQICIPAAGIVRDGLAVKLDKSNEEVAFYPEQDFLKTLNINLIHPTYWAMETIASVARNRISNGKGKWQADEEIQGSIVLIGSVSSRGNRGQVAYAAAKSALIGVSSTLNLEGLFHGVQTKIIHPGFVDTPMVESIDPDYFEKNLKPLIGLGRKIRPAEIADIVCAMIENPVLSGQIWADASLTPLA